MKRLLYVTVLKKQFSFFKYSLLVKIILPLFIVLCALSSVFAQNIPDSPNDLTFVQKGMSASGFIKNCGQVQAMEGGKAENVLYAFVSSSDVGVYVTNRGISYVYKKLLDKKDVSRNSKLAKKISNKTDSNTIFHFAAERVDVNLVHAHIDSFNTEVEYKENSPVSNYYIGNTHIENQRLIKKIVFKNIYTGIDWVLYPAGNSDQKIKYDFVVHENANTDNIQLAYSGNTNVQSKKDSGLLITSRLGFVEEGKPVLYIRDTNIKANISYKIKNNTIHYTIDKQLKDKAFIIDPDLVWGTFLHSEPGNDGLHSSQVTASDIETDAQGNIFIALACSGKILFPTVNPGNGAYFSSIYDSINGSDVYMKFNSSRVLLWSTYFAGGGRRAQITTNKKGELISASSYYGDNLPYKRNGGFFDSGKFISSCYLAKFSNDGALLWCTNFSAYIFNDITTDDVENIYITGDASPGNVVKKDPGNGAYMAPFVNGDCLFISKFDKDCNLTWSTPMQSSGNGGDNGSRIAIDANNNLYLLGQTIRSGKYVQLDAGGFYEDQQTLSAISRFNSSCQLTWSTFLPGWGKDVVADTSGNIFVVGQSYADWFPYVDPGNGAYTDPDKNFYHQGGYVMRFDQQTNLTWSTTYFNSVNFEFQYVLFEKYRNLIHVYGVMNSGEIPTHNDACSGSYYFSHANTATDPVLLTFTTAGKSLYTSLNNFPYAYYNIAECSVDNKGNLFYIFGQIQESGPLATFPALKDPGNGAYYEEGTNNYMSNASFVMELKPSSLNADTSYTVPQNCGCNGTLSVIPFCGSGNYKYEWSRGDNTATIVNVCAGNYSVKVTDLNSYSDTTIRFNLPNPVSNINGASLTFKGEHCNKNDGELLVKNIQGGPSPYSYSLNGQLYVTDSSFKKLNSGNYYVYIKDNDGCVFRDSVSIANLTGPIGIKVSALPAACDKVNGKIIIDEVKGGTSPFQYSIDNNTQVTNNTFINLAADKYLIAVYDSAFCKFEDSVVVAKAQAPDSININVQNTHCEQATGSVVINNVYGGKPPFLYSLDNIIFTSSNTLNNLAAGDEKIIVKDSNGCVASDIFTVQNIPGPEKIFLTKADALCGNEFGSIVIDSLQQGVLPFQYSINGSPYTSNNISNNVPAGKTIVVAKDAFNCFVKDSTIIEKTNALVIKINPADTFVCAADKITFTSSLLSNNINVQYYWNNSPLPSNVYSGTFYSTNVINVYAEDNNGCTANANTTINVKYCDSLLVKCIEMPSAFTPNHDGLNDFFGAHSSGCEVHNYKLTVYNRWGSIVFQTKDAAKKWDGNVNSIPEPIGSFIYYCEWQDALGIVRKLKGTVTLLR